MQQPRASYPAAHARRPISAAATTTTQTIALTHVVVTSLRFRLCTTGDPGSPVVHNLKRKVLTTTWVSAIVWVVVVAAAEIALRVWAQG